jgi:hypothetical protein
MGYMLRLNLTFMGPCIVNVFYKYSKTCLKRNAIVPVFFFPFSQVSVLIKQSTKNMIA